MVKGIIYKIIADDPATGKFITYIGSTAYDVNLRLSQHLCHYRMHLEGKHNYVSSFEVISRPWYEINVIETLEFTKVDDLLKREREFIDLYRLDDDYIVVNNNLPIRTPAERLDAVRRYHHTQKGRAALSRAMKRYYQRKKAKQNKQMPPNTPV